MACPVDSQPLTGNAGNRSICIDFYVVIGSHRPVTVTLITYRLHIGRKRDFFVFHSFNLIV